MDEDKRPIRQAILLLLVTGLMVWSELPEWQRATFKATASMRVRKGLAWMARRSGHAAMGDELAGHNDAASAGYSLTYRLSRLRDRL